MIYKDGTYEKSEIFELKGNHRSISLDNELEIELELIMPENYSENRNKRYPLVYLLDGMDGTSEEELMFDEIFEKNSKL